MRSEYGEGSSIKKEHSILVWFGMKEEHKHGNIWLSMGVDGLGKHQLGMGFNGLASRLASILQFA